MATIKQALETTGIQVAKIPVINSPLALLVRSLQVCPSDYLTILQSLELFDESNICLIIVGYISPLCTLTPPPSLPREVIDRVGAPEFSSSLSSVRFCFPSIPTFVSLNHPYPIDVGLTIKSTPYIDAYISLSESTYVSLECYGQSVALVNTVLRDGETYPECPQDHRLAYIDLVYDFSKKEIHVCVAHAQSETSTNLEFMRYRVTTQNSRSQLLMKTTNEPLYPFLSCRRIPIDVSLHALD